jgi:hypothetical protein
MGLMIFALVVLIVVSAVVIGVVLLLAWLPGALARGRSHPQASAISVAGYSSLLLPVLWPLALVWAYTLPPEPLDGSEVARLSERLADLEARLEAVNPPTPDSEAEASQPPDLPSATPDPAPEGESK